VAFSLAGQLLISKPALHDSNFDGTITLLLEHNSDGALGLIINRPSALLVEDAFPVWGSLAVEPGVVFAGGPVERTGLLALGATPNADGALALGLHSLDIDSTAPTNDGLAIDRVRVFAGYAGWGVGQLEGEIANGAWWVADGFLADLFFDQPDQLWAKVLRRNGGEMAWFAHFPQDASLN